MKETIENICNGQAVLIEEVAKEIWSYAELSLEEYKSATYLTKKLFSMGFQVKKGICGFPTGFLAEYSRGENGPVIGLLCEYDALPNMGDEAGSKNGHGCGHNLFAAGAIGTAISLKKIMEENNINGTIKVFGCPAEEVYGSKPFYAKQGYFNGLDCILGFHPLEFNGVLYAQHNALKEKRYRFYGKASHAGAEPELGVSALDAVELMNVAVNYLREHVTSDVRIHYIIDNGGVRANIVPDFASSVYNIRAQQLENLNKVSERIDQIARGIALAIGCRVEIEEGMTLANTIVNKELSKLAYSNLLKFGGTKFTKEEKEKIKELNIEGELLEDIQQLPQELGQYTASTDEGDASWFAPWVRVCTSCFAYGTPGHSYKVVAQGNGSAAIKGTIQTVKVITGMICDILTKDDILKKLRKSHKERLKDLNYDFETNKYPQIKKFPNIPGIIVTEEEIIIDCYHIDLLETKDNVTIKVYQKDKLIGSNISNCEGKIIIKYTTPLRSNSYIILKYVSEESKEDTLLGYYKV